jgi:hypothetical protein
MLTLLRLIVRTMIRPFGGLNEEAIHPLPQRLQRLRRRQCARRHQIEMHQGVLQHRRELVQVFVGFRPRHRQLRAQNITGGRRCIRVEDKRSFLRHGWQCPFGPTARVAPARAGLDPFFIRVVLGCPGDITEDGQQRVALGLGQASQGFHLTIVSDVQPHRSAPSMVF